MKSNQEIIAIANEAIQAANISIPYCATRYTENKPTTEGEYQSIVDANDWKSDADVARIYDQIKKNRDTYKKLYKMKSMEEFNETVEKIRVCESGNCEELSILAAAYIFENYPELKPYVGIYRLASHDHSEGADHMFVVIALDDASKWEGYRGDNLNKNNNNDPPLPKDEIRIIICDPLYQSTFLNNDAEEKLRCLKIDINDTFKVLHVESAQKIGFASSNNLNPALTVTPEGIEAKDQKEAINAEVAQEMNTDIVNSNLNPLPTVTPGEALFPKEIEAEGQKEVMNVEVVQVKNTDFVSSNLSSLTNLASYKALITDQIQVLERRLANPGFLQDVTKISDKLSALTEIKNLIEKNDTNKLPQILKNHENVIKASTRQNNLVYFLRATPTSVNLYDQFMKDINEQDNKIIFNPKKP